MQLPTFTVPPDSNPLALFLAASTPEGAGLTTETPPAAGFDELFAHLTPALKPKATEEAPKAPVPAGSAPVLGGILLAASASRHELPTAELAGSDSDTGGESDAPVDTEGEGGSRPEMEGEGRRTAVGTETEDAPRAAWGNPAGTRPLALFAGSGSFRRPLLAQPEPSPESGVERAPAHAPQAAPLATIGEPAVTSQAIPARSDASEKPLAGNAEVREPFAVARDFAAALPLPASAAPVAQERTGSRPNPAPAGLASRAAALPVPATAAPVAPERSGPWLNPTPVGMTTPDAATEHPAPLPEGTPEQPSTPHATSAGEFLVAGIRALPTEQPVSAPAQPESGARKALTTDASVRGGERDFATPVSRAHAGRVEPAALHSSFGATGEPTVPGVAMRETAPGSQNIGAEGREEAAAPNPMVRTWSRPVPPSPVAVEPMSSAPAANPPALATLASRSSSPEVVPDELAPVLVAPALTPPSAPRRSAAAAAAKFADEGESDLPVDSESILSGDKSFLNAVSEPFAKRIAALGIGVAKDAPAMSNRSATSPLPHPVSEYGAAAIPAAGGLAGAVVEAAGGAGEALPPETVPSAQRAVEAVLQAADRMAVRQQNSVSLKFTIGDADLNVRVELQANELRTTFRTDSAELRAALSQEWQFVTAANAGGDRAVRLAPPSFGPGEQSAAQNLAGDTFSQQRQRDARREAGDASSAALSRLGLRPAAADRGPAAAARPAANPRSLHLHTLA